MPKSAGFAFLLSALLTAGCLSTHLDDPRPVGPRPASPGSSSIPIGQPADIVSRIVPLSGENTRVTFVGSAGKHSHEGCFDRLAGDWTLTTDDPKDSRLSVRIETDSVRTRLGLLTTHLKSEDFFSCKKFPTATFQSHKIDPEPGPDGTTHRVTGDFTFRGTTRRLTFPAKIAISTSAVALDGRFNIKQTAFGITLATENTKDDIPVTVSINAARR